MQQEIILQTHYFNQQDPTHGGQIILQIPPNDLEAFQILQATIVATIINLNKNVPGGNNATEETNREEDHRELPTQTT
jgi:hypothetical protein